MFDEIEVDRESEIIDIAQTLQRCAGEMARLKRMEEELNKRMAALMEHGEAKRLIMRLNLQLRLKEL